MNPYIEILNHMRIQGSKLNPPSILIGQMINANTLRVGELQITKDNLLIADYLLQGYTRQVSINDGIASTLKTEDGLKAGDIVAVMPTADRQTYIVLCKVVKP